MSQIVFPRDERHFCQECGQYYALHMNMPASATEPPEQWCCEEKPDQERPDPFDEDAHQLPRAAGSYWENLDIQF